MKKTEETKPTKKDEAMAALMLDRKERVERAGKAIEEACQKEKVTLTVAGFALNDGRLLPQIQLVAID